MTSNLSRRQIVIGAAVASTTVASPFLLRRPAGAAEFTARLATTIPPDHPINARAREAAAAIEEKSSGRVKIEVYPGYVLGSSTSALSQLRGGGIQMLTLSGSVLSTIVPASTIYNVAFAFKNYTDVWAALDGKLGDHIRSKIAEAGIQPLGKHWDLGFRHLTTGTKPVRSVSDLRGMKFRVPVAPLFVSCFEALGASPASINFDEVYSSLQTKLIDGQENDLVVIDTAKLYEVQKYCALTSHIWDGYYTLANDRLFWKKLSPDLQNIVSESFGAAAVAERNDMITATQITRDKLTQGGLAFNEVDRSEFQAALKKANYYSQWREKFGREAWDLLETVSGSLG